MLWGYVACHQMIWLGLDTSLNCFQIFSLAQECQNPRPYMSIWNYTSTSNWAKWPGDHFYIADKSECYCCWMLQVTFIQAKWTFDNFLENFPNSQKRNGILLPKLFWPIVRKKCSSDREKFLKLEAEGREFANILRSLEQFVQTVKGQNNFW